MIIVEKESAAVETPRRCVAGFSPGSHRTTRIIHADALFVLDMQPYGCIIGWVDMDKVFKALADPGRRLLLDRLCMDNGQTLGQLCEHLDMTRQAVTKHLKILEEAGLVVPIWRGREKFHYLNPVPIHDIAERWIGKFEHGRLRVLAELKKRLEGESDG